MEEILLQHLGLTKEEFDKGLQDFFISKQSKNNTSKDGFGRYQTTFILDTMLNNGIPKGGINTFTSTSNYGSIYHDYILHLISNYKIENRNKKLNDLGI
jgi:hypothetical protein